MDYSDDEESPKMPFDDVLWHYTDDYKPEQIEYPHLDWINTLYDIVRTALITTSLNENLPDKLTISESPTCIDYYSSDEGKEVQCLWEKFLERRFSIPEGSLIFLSPWQFYRNRDVTVHYIKKDKLKRDDLSDV